MLQKQLSIEIFFTGNWLSVRRMGRDEVGIISLYSWFVYKAGKRYPLYRQIFCQYIFYVFRKDWNFSIKFRNYGQRLKKTFSHTFSLNSKHLWSQISISRYGIQITNFLLWQRRIHNTVKHLRRRFLRKQLMSEGR